MSATLPAVVYPTALDLATYPTCRVCGCYEYAACEEGCSWVEADLCSTCAGRPAQLRDALADLAALTAAIFELDDVIDLTLAQRRLQHDQGEPVDLVDLSPALSARGTTSARLRDATMRAQQLLDATRWPVAFDEEDPR